VAQVIPAMKIGFVCCEYPPAPHGGIGSVTQVLGRALAGAGHEVRVIGIYSGGGLAHQEFDSGVQVWRMPAPGGRLGWTEARRELYRTVSHWSERGEVDVLEVPDWQGYAAGWPALRIPVVARLHGSASYFASEMNDRLRWPDYCLEAASFHRADFCCSTSAYTAERTGRLFGPRLRPVDVLFNPVELAPQRQQQRSPHRVVFAGTLTAKKGVVPLVQSWPAVMAACPNAELHLYGPDAGAGDGRPMRELLESKIPPAMAESVRFHGRVERERILAEFQTCALAVFPSFSEAFSMVPLEAMSESCPVICSNRSSGPELIDHGINGLLVDPGCPESIAEAIVSLLSDQVLRDRLAAAGRRTVATRFATGVLLERNEEFFRSCIQRH
jgi:glycosyltransferase involved in cell wall biosynthesis